MLSGERQKATDVLLNFCILKSLITVVISVLGIISSLGVTAQSGEADSLIRLDEVVITQTRLQNYAVGHYLLPVDSLTSRLASMSNAAELLRKFGYGHIRSYGVGGVTTPSFRGTGASHTAVLWNGINIISPLNGQSDLSLLPVNFIDDVQLQTGGSASLYGSGAIGGTIQFNNKARFGQGLNISLTENIGSFRTFFHGLSATWSGKKWVSSTRLFQTSAANNFAFTNRNVAPPRQERRQHNAFDQHGILQQNYFQINKQQLISLRFWYQDNHVDIPEPSTVPRPGTSTQRDKFYRSMIGWNYDYNGGHVFVQSAHVHHMLDYRHPPSNTFSVNTFDTFINTFENTLSISEGIEWTSGANYTLESITGPELGASPNRNRVALYTAFKQEWGKVKNVLSARQEAVNGKLAPFAPSLGLDYKVSKGLSLFGSISHNYRIPTFNDLYWNDGLSKGNPGLKMETSWSEEVGLRLKVPSTVVNFTWQLAAFSNQVDNMIYWGQSSGIWTPENVRKAWTRGVETTGTLRKMIGKLSSELIGRYSYTLATTEAVYDPNKVEEIGNQLVFTPKNELGTTLRLTWRSYNLSFTNNYTGRQYTDDGNTEYLTLKRYNITSLWLSRDLRLKKLTILFMTELNNIFNSQVSTRPGYPLPGRNFKAGITIKFNKPIRT
jgi:iron complex outermembrane receptor protein